MFVAWIQLRKVSLGYLATLPHDRHDPCHPSEENPQDREVVVVVALVQAPRRRGGDKGGGQGPGPPNHAQFLLVPLISSYISLEIK
jgi:hypothetical protein